MKKLRYSRVLALAFCATFAVVSCEGILGGPDDPFEEPEIENYYITVKPGDAVFPAEGGTVEFTATTNAKHTGCSYPKRDWLSVYYDKSIKKYVVTVDANNSGEEREFKLTFYCYNTSDEEIEDSRSVTCVQRAAAAAGDAWVGASPSSLEFSADKGTKNLVITWSEGVTKLRFVRGNSITDWVSAEWKNEDGKKLLVVTAAANDTAEERSGTISVYAGVTAEDIDAAVDGNLDPSRAAVVNVSIRQAAGSSQPGNAPEGALGGLFTVNENGKAVRFSQGNLQYQASTKTWRFAQHQWDYVGFKYYVETGDDYFEWVYTGTMSGNTNENISSSYSGWIDVFGWGTSGYDGRYPYMTVLDPSYYNIGNGKSIAGTKYDWGVYNAISNGGNQAGMWRTLTRDEWEYVVVGRNIAYLCAPATVADVHGLILLPDNWNPSTYYLDNINVEEWYNWDVNKISASDWISKLEPAGAVFLPCAGQRGNINYPDEETVGGGTGPEGVLPFSGGYWSSTLVSYNSSEIDDDGANTLWFDYGGGNPVIISNYLCVGLSVRLVAD